MVNLVVNVTGRCNLACRYCYAGRYRGDYVVSDGVLECLFSRASELSAPRVDFFWQGGEVLLLGLGFFRKIKKLQDKMLSGKVYCNHIQTNGTLLDREYARYFKKNDFHVGVSLDGPREIHDANRVYPGSKGSFNDVMRGVDAAGKEGLRLGFIALLSRTGVGRIGEIYRFFSGNNFRFRLNPIAVELGHELSITPEEYSNAITELYDLACESEGKEVLEDPALMQNLFMENYLSFRSNLSSLRSSRISKTVSLYERTVLTNLPVDCHSLPRCHVRMTGIDYNGDVYPCVRFSGDKSQKLGSIFESSLDDIRNSAKTEELCKRDLDAMGCGGCQWKDLCNGGCPYISYISYGTRNRKDYYCNGYQMVLSHISGRLGGGCGLLEGMGVCPAILYEGEV